MLRRTLPIIFLSSALLMFAFACKTEQGVGTNKANPGETPPELKATGTPAAQKSLTAEKTGVPECDEFIANYDACVSSKVPEVARAQYKTAIEQWRTSWKKLAENPQTKSTLAAACKQSAEQARASMKTYNCTF